MERIEIIKNNRKIKLYGNKAIVEKEKTIIENLNLTGLEDKDRIIIQDCIDKNKLKSDYLPLMKEIQYIHLKKSLEVIEGYKKIIHWKT